MENKSDNNILAFKDSNNDIKFISTSVWIDFLKKEDGKYEKRHIAIVSIKDSSLDIEVIHPITQFIVDGWKLHKFNTQRKHANNTVKFLNYLKHNRRSLGIKSLRELSISHANKYLTGLTQDEKARGTVKDAERTLTNFYVWLVKNRIIDSIPLERFVKKESHYGKDYYESPFEVVYPQIRASNMIHMLPVDYIPLLLEVAIQVAKPIALGIYFQIFGGIRVSEVINLKKTQVKVRIKTGDLSFSLQNQNFRTDLKEHSSVKKPRTQRVFNIKDWGDTLFYDHIQLYKSKEYPNALFVNRDGMPMSQRSYRQYFEKVKRTFIKLLEEEGDFEQKILAKQLKCYKWSTHIGRGTFTNMIAENADNPYEVSFPRGDSSLESALSYMSRTARLRKK